MPKKGKRGQGRFSKNSPSNRSQRNGGFRRVFVGSLQSPTEPPKDYFPMSGRQSLAKELNALAESDDIDDDDTPQNKTHLQKTSNDKARLPINFTSQIIIYRLS